jgi:hypothetical protein
MVSTFVEIAQKQLVQDLALVAAIAVIVALVAYFVFRGPRKTL